MNRRENQITPFKFTGIPGLQGPKGELGGEGFKGRDGYVVNLSIICFKLLCFNYKILIRFKFEICLDSMVWMVAKVNVVTMVISV